MVLTSAASNALLAVDAEGGQEDIASDTIRRLAMSAACAALRAVRSLFLPAATAAAAA